MRQYLPDLRRLSALGCLACIVLAGSPCTAQDAQATPDTPEQAAPPPFEILRRSPHGLPVVAIQVANKRYEMEIAATDSQRRRGFGGRTELPPGSGMLFVHPDDTLRRFWMKDCLIDIDIAFLDGQGRIVALHRMKKEPPRRDGERLSSYEDRLTRYPSRRPARYALEFQAGTLDRLKLKVGQSVPLPHEELRKLTRGPA
ncbi:MAG: DUF192 domain-containing protein [Phycisphaerales bacterium]|nr:DUF192 domain-containing protein [Phycisphaerales bacterium]